MSTDGVPDPPRALSAVEVLVATEAIERLKARYFRLLDTKRWDEWGDVFTAGAVLRFGPGDDEVLHGREAIVAGVSAALGDGVTVHHGYLPEIDVLSATTATGTWAMADDVSLPGLRLRGAGHYHERYVKGADGEWRIASTELVRLRRGLSPDPSPVEVRAAAADLVARYNVTADAGRFDETLALFTEDAVLELPSGSVHRGHDEIRPVFTGTAASLAARSEVGGGDRPRSVSHVSATVQVDLDGPDRARGRAYYVVFLDEGPDHWGRYVDEYRLVDGTWRIAHRRVTVDGRAPGGWASRRASSTP